MSNNSRERHEREEYMELKERKRLIPDSKLKTLPELPTNQYGDAMEEVDDLVLSLPSFGGYQQFVSNINKAADIIEPFDLLYAKGLRNIIKEKQDPSELSKRLRILRDNANRRYLRQRKEGKRY